ncbi:hypothetical protein AV530_013962 [Patagioenas fasciata monilis]|uniref:Uncharacterized protein n=1 Tax=Patagioenas fasciata monilis TaxID=372326 RepID=A0A1V4J4S2_PATFA|nr:hypothetical protein AV530_013962 [Patagioenas fasciata monilis]
MVDEVEPWALCFAEAGMDVPNVILGEIFAFLLVSSECPGACRQMAQVSTDADQPKQRETKRKKKSLRGEKCKMRGKMKNCPFENSCREL